MDRWILAELAQATAGVIERMDQYDNYAACGFLTAYVDALSNWYVRRSRDRFWSADKRSADKRDAYWTLYECLLSTAKLVAPFVPFLAEALWQNLAVAPFGQRVLKSVHLCDYPTAESDDPAADAELSQRMNLVREIVSQGRAARMNAKLKVRQPLAKVEVILAERAQQPWLQQHSALIAEELNVKLVEFTQHAERYITYTVLPDLKRLGPKLGKRLPALKTALAQADAGQLLARLNAAGSVEIALSDGAVSLDSQDLQIRLQAKPGWAAAQGPHCVVVLATELNEELITEGVARELVHAIQNIRKDIDCQYSDRILVGIVSDDAGVQSAVERFGDYIAGETLATKIDRAALSGVSPTDTKVGEARAELYVKVVPA